MSTFREGKLTPWLSDQEVVEAAMLVIANHQNLQSSAW